MLTQPVRRALVDRATDPDRPAPVPSRSPRRGDDGQDRSADFSRHRDQDGSGPGRHGRGRRGGGRHARPATASDAGAGSPGSPVRPGGGGRGRPGRCRPRRRPVRLAGRRLPARRRAVGLPDRGDGPGPVGVDGVGQGPVASGRQAFVPYGGPPLSADARYRWTVATADDGGPLEPAQRSGHLHDRPARQATGRRSGCGPAGRPRPGGVHLPARPPGRSRRHHRPGHGVRGRRPQVPAVGQRRPSRHRPQLLLSRRAVLPGHRYHLGPVPGRATPSASSTTGTGRARAVPSRPRACSSRWRCTTPTAHG